MLSYCLLDYLMSSYPFLSDLILLDLIRSYPILFDFIWSYHLLPSFAQAKYTGLLPRRHATVFAGFLPELSELALVVGKLVSHAARRGRRSKNWRNWWFLEPTRQFELSFVPAWIRLARNPGTNSRPQDGWFVHVFAVMGGWLGILANKNGVCFPQVVASVNIEKLRLSWI